VCNKWKKSIKSFLSKLSYFNLAVNFHVKMEKFELRWDLFHVKLKTFYLNRSIFRVKLVEKNIKIMHVYAEIIVLGEKILLQLLCFFKKIIKSRSLCKQRGQKNEIKKWTQPHPSFDLPKWLTRYDQPIHVSVRYKVVLWFSTMLWYFDNHTLTKCWHAPDGGFWA
jgi:hypothetical protein